MGGYSFPTLCLVAAGAVAAIAASVPPEDYTATASGQSQTSADDATTLLSHEYDPEAVAAYFDSRPLLVAQRAAQLSAELSSFGVCLLGDYWGGNLQRNERGRAEQLRGGIERLGPAYVKVAQALSTRVDLLTPAYFEQIQLLQDRVPPFPCEDAKKVRRYMFYIVAQENVGWGLGLRQRRSLFIHCHSGSGAWAERSANHLSPFRTPWWDQRHQICLCIAPS